MLQCYYPCAKLSLIIKVLKSAEELWLDLHYFILNILLSNGNF